MTGEKQNVCTGAVHLVRLSGMDSFLLNSLDAQLLQFLIEDLAKIHDHGLMNLLPQMSSENLDEGNLQSWDLAVQENTSQIQLHLETNIDIGSV